MIRLTSFMVIFFKPYLGFFLVNKLKETLEIENRVKSRLS